MCEATFPAFQTGNGDLLIYCSESCRDREPIKLGYQRGVLAEEVPDNYPCAWCEKDVTAMAKEQLAEASRTDFMVEFDPLEKGQGEAFGAAVDRLKSMSLRQIASAAERMTMDQRRQFAEHFEGMASQMARIAAYLDSRYGGGCGDQGHETAVKEQNRIGRAVRKAQGYSKTLDINC